MNLKALRLSDRDLDFLVETVSPEVTDKLKLRLIISEDEDFKNIFIGDKRVFKRVMDDDEIFLLGLCADYAERNYRYPLSREVRPQIAGKARISPEDYEKEGRKFYKLAAEHKSAKELDLSEVFWALHGNFEKAKKPLNFIAEHYLQYKRHRLFG